MPEKPVFSLDPIAREIAQALAYLGGAAHRDRVIECVGAMRRQRGEAVQPTLFEEVVAAFERWCGRRPDEAPFFRPFGDGSNRWALAEA